MDLAVLPEIFALALLLGAYRPLVRRVGAHVSLWFIGWCCLMAHFLVLFAVKASLASHPIPHFFALITLEACGLIFILASANTRMRRIGRTFIAELAIPMVAQAALYGMNPAHNPARFILLHRLVNVLFILPLLPVLVRKPARKTHRIIISIAFALFGLAPSPSPPPTPS